MNIFSVGDGEAYELTRNEYINRTHKKFPFYQDVKKYKTPYFAICPACNNPIQIINLFGAQYEEEQTCRTTMHGRHFTRNVDGLPAYNQENYNGCPLHNPVAFRIRQIRETESVNEEIRDLVENNIDKLANDIRKITGVLLKNEKIMKLIDDYIEARDYCYTHTNKFNIPYSILYTREVVNIFGQKISQSELGERINLAINNNSNYFRIEEGRIIKKVPAYVSIHLLVTNHRIAQGGRQYMAINIEESNGNEHHLIFHEEVEIKQYTY